MTADIVAIVKSEIAHAANLKIIYVQHVGQFLL